MYAVEERTAQQIRNGKAPILLRNKAVQRGRESYDPWQIERANWSCDGEEEQRAVVGDGMSGGVCVWDSERKSGL